MTEPARSARDTVVNIAKWATPNEEEGYIDTVVTSGGLGRTEMDQTTQVYIDKSVELAMAKTETRLVEVVGEIRNLESKISGELRNIEANSVSTKSMWAGVGTTILSLAALILALLSFGGDMLNTGLDLAPQLSKITTDQKERDQMQDQRLQLILDRLDQLAPPPIPTP